MFRKLALALVLFGALAVTKTHAGLTLVGSGYVKAVNYKFSTAGKLKGFTMEMVWDDGSPSFSVNFNAPSGTDIKDYRSLAEALSIGENAMRSYLHVSFRIVTASGSGTTTIPGASGNTVDVGSTTDFQMKPWNQ